MKQTTLAVGKLTAPMSLRALGARHCAHVLALAGNKLAACKALGISYHTLQGYLADYRVLTAEQESKS
jgi:hypothetical protein